MRTTTRTGNILKTLALIGLVMGPGLALAQSKNAPKAAAPKADQVDISDVETKYWAPKDTDFNVVQNRTYTKEKRFSISGQYGLVINDGLNEGHTTSFNLNYYFTERWGVQANYSLVSLGNSDMTKAVIQANGSPDFGRVKSYYDIGLNWVPFYAKMSVMGKKIIYFDMAFTPVIGMMNYEAQVRSSDGISKSSMTYGFDVTQLFFIQKNFAFRLDLRQRYFKEDIVKFYKAGGDVILEGTKLRTKDSDHTTLIFGAAVFF